MTDAPKTSPRADQTLVAAMRERYKLYAEGVIEVYGPREPLDWSEWPACIVRGVKYA